jgi:hypothetical protein
VLLEDREGEATQPGSVVVNSSAPSSRSLICAMTARRPACEPHRLDLEGLVELFGRDQRAGGALVTGWPPRLRPDGGTLGRRLTLIAGGSVEVGFEELVEFCLSRAFNSAIRASSEAVTARTAAWASGGTVFQNDSGSEGCGLLQQILRT